MKTLHLKYISLFIFLIVSCDQYKELSKIASGRSHIKVKKSEFNIPLDDDKNYSFNGVKEPPLPAPEINNSTLLGVDSDNNGIRDDIDRWINRVSDREHGKYIKMILQKRARFFNEILSISYLDKQNIIDFSKKSYFKQSACSAIVIKRYLKKDFRIISQSKEYLRKLYFNNKLRKRKLSEFDSNLSGQSFGFPSYDTSLKYCDIEKEISYENNFKLDNTI